MHVQSKTKYSDAKEEPWKDRVDLTDCPIDSPTCLSFGYWTENNPIRRIKSIFSNNRGCVSHSREKRNPVERGTFVFYRDQRDRQTSRQASAEERIFSRRKIVNALAGKTGREGTHKATNVR